MKKHLIFDILSYRISEVKRMSDFSERNKVVQANELIQTTNWTLQEIPLKIFKVVISCIDTKNPKEIITITKNELYFLLGSEHGKNYNYLKKQLKYLQATSLDLVENQKKWVSVSLINDVEWNKETDLITIELSKRLLPYLVDLQERFLQYDVMNIKHFQSKYGLIFYEYLLSREREERRESKIYRISTERLRLLTGTQNKYKKFKDFELNVLRVGIDDINQAKVEFLVRYNKIKEGRSIKYIDFEIRKRTSVLEENFEQIKTPKYLEGNI